MRIFAEKFIYTQLKSQLFTLMKHFTLNALLTLVLAFVATSVHAQWAVTDVATLQSGDVVVIADATTSTAMSNSSFNTKGGPNAVAITIAADTLKAAPESSVKWTVTKNGSNYTFTKYGEDTYLYCISDNNGLRVGTGNDNKVFSMKDGFLYNNGQKRYVGVLTNTSVSPVTIDWRSYTSVNNNIKATKVTFFRELKDDSKAVAGLAFSEAAVRVVFGQTLTDVPVLQRTTTAAVTYASSDEAVATVDAATGEVTIVGPGRTTITASAAENDDYLAGQASYSLTVAQPVEGLGALRAATTATSSASAQPFCLTLDKAIVTYVNGPNTYMEDATGGVLVYQSDKTFEAGYQLTGDVYVDACLFNGMLEITNWEYTTNCTLVYDCEVPVTEATIADITAAMAQYENRRVKVIDAVVTADMSSTEAARTAAMAQGDAAMAIYDKAAKGSLKKLQAAAEPVDSHISVIGYPAMYKQDAQLNVWSDDDIFVLAAATATLTVEQTDLFVGDVIEIRHESNSTATPVVTVSDGSVIAYGKGHVMAIGAGTATLTVTYPACDDFAAATASVVINVNKKSCAISVEATEITMKVGESRNLNASCESDAIICLMPDNSGVVTVEDDGTITAVKAGECTVRYFCEATDTYAAPEPVLVKVKVEDGDKPIIDPQYDEDIAPEDALYFNGFNGSMGDLRLATFYLADDLSSYSTEAPEDLPEGVWRYIDNNGFMEANPYNANLQAHKTVARLHSPVIDLTNYAEATLSFTHAARFVTGIADNAKVYAIDAAAYDDPSKEPVEGEDFIYLDLSSMPKNEAFVPCEADLTFFAGRRVIVVFEYDSTGDDAAIWRIDKICVKGAEVPEGVQRETFISLSADAPCYDLAGRRVNAAAKGIVIDKDKKVIRK